MLAARRQLRSRIRIAAAAVATTISLVVPAQALACSGANQNPNDMSLDAAEHATLCLLNDIRRDHHLRPFRDNGRLGTAARRHARDMAVHNYFAHGDFVGRIRSAHYLGRSRGWTVGENIAWGSWDYATPSEIVDGWMHSPPHRHNILNGRFREIGVGVARGAPVGGQDRAGTYVTDFGTRF